MIKNRIKKIVPNDQNGESPTILDIELVGDTQVTRKFRQRKDGSSIMDFDTFTRAIILPQGKFDEFIN